MKNADLREKMKIAYNLGVDAYKKGFSNLYADSRLAKILYGLDETSKEYIRKEWLNGYKEEELSS